MKFNTKIHIVFLDFIKHGKFDVIKLGQSKEWILNNFADPDKFDENPWIFKRSNCSIWTYGNIEFHFDKENNLWLIFSDYLEQLDGGKYKYSVRWL